MSNLMENIAELYGRMSVRLFHIVAVHSATDHYFDSMQGDPAYHLSGLVSAAVGRGLDLASTVKAVEIMNSPEHERLDPEYQIEEGNPLLGKKPTKKQLLLRSLPLEVLVLTVSYLTPSLGYGISSVGLILYYNNRKKIEKVQKAIDEMVESESAE